MLQPLTFLYLNDIFMDEATNLDSAAHKLLQIYTPNFSHAKDHNCFRPFIYKLLLTAFVISKSESQVKLK